MPRAKRATSGRKLHPTDVAIGQNLRLARLRAEHTQESLAAEVGISFQQVQKYERGANRLSLVRAREFATILKISILQFFDDVEVVANTARLERAQFGKWLALYTRAQDAGVLAELIRIVEKIVGLQNVAQSESNTKNDGAR